MPTMRDPAHRFLPLSLAFSQLLILVAVLTCTRWLPAQQDQPVKPRQARAEAKETETFQQEVKPLLMKFCSECHNEDEPTEGVAVDGVSNGSAVRVDRKTWTRVLQRVEFHAMPPKSEPQPTDEQRATIVSWLENVLFHLDCEKQTDPGRVTVRRLNRLEYHNTIRDLFGVELDPTRDFPSDDVGEGFDNIGDVLSLPPLLFEKYIEAAEQISQSVVLAVDKENPDNQRFEKNQLRLTGAAKLVADGTIVMTSRGTAEATLSVASAGTYRLLVQAGAQQAGDEVAKIEFTVDGKPVGQVDVPASQRAMQEYGLEVTMAVGDRRIGASFVNDYYQPKDPDPANRDRNMFLRWIELVGPQELDPDNLPESHRRIVTVQPGEELSVVEAASEVLAPLMRRAFRRPVPAEQLQGYAQLAELATERGESFERGLQVAITAMLVSPRFLFRLEGTDRLDDPATIRQLDDFELASRLSYFIWSSMPDERLLALAGKGQLGRASVLREEVRRMLADPRSRGLVDGFASQWLNLRNLDEVSPDPDAFPFSDELRADMRQETEMFFEAVMRDDRPITELLSGRYSFLNGRLAEHYGIDGVEGGEFRRVSLLDYPRAGVLTQASILTLTSDPTRTSPVKRGKWIMENILGTPPPDPPADVPEIGAAREALPGASFREQLELHRESPRCAVCHVEMDALGFGMENFDGIGRWRTELDSQPIDASGTLPGGHSFEGPIQMIEILGENEPAFVRAFTRKLLVFALGRGLKYYDRCTVDEIVKQLSSDSYTFSTIVEQIVLSDAFRKRRAEGAAK